MDANERDDIFVACLNYITTEKFEDLKSLLDLLTALGGDPCDVQLLQSGAGPHLLHLPEELLSTLGRHLSSIRTEIEECVSVELVENSKIIAEVLLWLCRRNFDNIPFVASCDFVSDLLIASASLVSRVGDGSSEAEAISRLIHFVILFLECLYDPYSIWPRRLSGNVVDSAACRYKPALLAIEVIPFFYECFQVPVTEQVKPLLLHCLNMLGSILCGSQHNALRAACPATLEVLLRCLGECKYGDEMKSVTAECIVSFTLVLIRCRSDQRQVDVASVMEGYLQQWQKLACNEYRLSNVKTLCMMLEKLPKFLKTSRNHAMQTHFVKLGWPQLMLLTFHDIVAQLPQRESVNLANAVVEAISVIILGNKDAKAVMAHNHGFSLLFEGLKRIKWPSQYLLEKVVNLACEEDLKVATFPKVINPEAVLLLVKWIPCIESVEMNLWLSEVLLSLCSSSLDAKITCCEAGMIGAVVSVLGEDNVKGKTGVNLVKLVEKLGSYSLTPVDLKKMFLLLRPSKETAQFLFTTHLVHAMSVMAKREGMKDSLYFFNFQESHEGITIPPVKKFVGYGVAFHAWVRLNHVSGQFIHTRRQLYSFLTGSGTGFEAFFLNDGTLVVAVCTKKEYLTVAASDCPLNDGCWHCIDVCHTASRRPFVQSQVTVYIDGTARVTARIKCPSLSDPFTCCCIGAPISAFHQNLASSTSNLLSTATKQSYISSTTAKLLTNLPGSQFFSLPSPLKPSSPCDEGVTMLSAGMQDKIWGPPSTLHGQLGVFRLFNDAILPAQVKSLYSAGPNAFHFFTSDDPDANDLASKLALYYHAKAWDGGRCADISPNQLYDGLVTGKRCVAWDMKESLSCIGGIQVLFPLLENSRRYTQQQSMPDLVTPEIENPDCEENFEDWVVLPNSSYSEWRLEQNQAAGFLILIRNIIQNSTYNREQLIHLNGVATIGALLQKIPPYLVNVQLLMAVQLLVETAASNHDVVLLHAIYQYILFDFRIWNKSDFTVRIGHIQYLSTIIKEDRKYFRKKYGVQYFLDVIRYFYSPHPSNVCGPEDSKAIRASILSLAKFFLIKDFSSKEMAAILAFMFSVKDESMLSEMVDMLLSIMENQHCNDQVFLLIYEPQCAELFYCLLLNPIYTIHFKNQLLKLILVVLKTDKIYDASKIRLKLLDVGIAGLLNRLEGMPFTPQIIGQLFEIILHPSSDSLSIYQGLLSLLYFIRTADIDVKLQSARMVEQVLRTNANAVQVVASQQSWHDCILQLLVKRTVLGTCEDAGDNKSYLSSSGASTSNVLNREMSCGSPSLNRTRSVEESSPQHSPKARTPHYLASLVFDFDALSLSFGDRSPSSSKASSVEDLSVQPAIAPSSHLDIATLKIGASTISTQTSFDAGVLEDHLLNVEMAEEAINSIQDWSLQNFASLPTGVIGDKEDELCNLVANIVFTIFWKGIDSREKYAWKVRGQVFTCINILALNNHLHASHLELKRKILELALHSAISDLKESGQAIVGLTENAIELMKWTYDFIVIDNASHHSSKISTKLLDGVLGLLDALMVFEEGPGGDEWVEMAQMGLGVLLQCMASHNLEICAMATPRLHTLVQTRIAWSPIEEVCYLMGTLNRIITQTVDADNHEHYSFLIPLMKALLEMTGPRLNLQHHLPSLPSNQAGPSFFEDFQQYCKSNEWVLFVDKQVAHRMDKYLQQGLQMLPDAMNEFWNECYESTMVAIHKRNRTWGESRLKFQSSIMEPFSNKCIEEQSRYNNFVTQLRNQNLMVRRRWHLQKLYLCGARGPWNFRNPPGLHWKLSQHENFSRMRLKLTLNLSFDSHAEASRLRDNLGIPQPQTDSLPLAFTQEAKIRCEADDSFDDEDMLSASASEIQEMELTGKEKLILSEECELVAHMSTVKGRLEVTTTHIYFFDVSPLKEEGERYDFKWVISQLREIHLRRYNLRRSALELFFLDQTNYFLNFTPKTRSKVYSRILGLRPPGLVIHSTGTPAEILNASGITQKWVHREISNFEYLMMLNTIAGRTYNDLSQYPVFPWVLCDYTSDELDLTDDSVFRDLSKPVGVVNPHNIPEVKLKYEHFEDPSGLVEKFHYGTHYSNSAGVLHYLVRLEPFTSLHIELQSGRFDVADRQFHSIPGTWKMLIDNPNDVKELIPEFFYLPEFLVNLNNFNLGVLQATKEPVIDVILPKWAKSPEDFIYKHRKALESEYVSRHLNEWIDLIFGYKQKGPAAVEALNVFYYCSYEGAVNLDTITDPVVRAATEGMINNFGQTPCQLLKEPHPTRMSFQDSLERISKLEYKCVSVLLFPHLLRLFEVEVSNARDPILYLSLPWTDSHSKIQHAPDFLVTVSQSGAIGLHAWMPFNKTISNFFTFDVDPTLCNAKTRRRLLSSFQPGLPINSNMFAMAHNMKVLFCGGFWDNAIRAFKFSKSKVVGHLIGHKDVVTCLALDKFCRILISGSRDGTCILWDVNVHAQTGREITSKVLQILYGHDAEVTCAAIMTDLDMAISGSRDGTINMYTVRDGLYLRTLKPHEDLMGQSMSEVDLLAVSEEGRIVVASTQRTDTGQVRHALNMYSINGKHIGSDFPQAATTALVVAGDYIVMGNSRGQLVLRELHELKVAKVLPLPSSVTHLTMTHRNTHILASLSNGKLMVVGLSLPNELI